MLRRIREVFAPSKKHGVDGLEHGDPRPMEIPANAKRPETLQQMVARLVMAEDFRKSLAKGEFETPEEASDFEIDGDDPEEVFSAHERLAHEIAENDDVREGRRAAEFARIAGRKSAGREDSRREDDSRGRSARRVRGDESSSDDDVDERGSGRRGEGDSEGDGGRYERRSDGGQRGRGGNGR